MKRDAMTEVWAMGESAFRLGLGELRALQSATGSGPAEVMARLVTSQWRVDDIIETLRLGLIGGGAKPETAKLMALNAFDEWAPYRLGLLAARILEQFLMQDPHDVIETPAGDGAAGEPAAPADAGASRSSTEPAR